MMSNVFKLAAVAVFSTLLLGCVGTAASPQKVLKPVVNYQCHQELKNSKLWKATTLVVGQEKRQAWQNQACECVSENALKDVPAQQLAHAMVNEEAKNQLVRQAVLNSVKGCILNVSHSEMTK